MQLQKWYAVHQRPLPWRVNPKFKGQPYAVWISEVMSQQSTLKMMMPYFDKWMKTFPTIKSLAFADEDLVLKLWAGLGYYSRARNLKKAALELHKKSQTHSFPKSAKEWQQLPGIGQYTSKAIAAICFDEKVLGLDGNVIRVLSRFYGVEDPLNNRNHRQRLEEIVALWEKSLPDNSSGKVLQSLMDLGAMICRPRNAAICGSCPLKENCISFERGQVAQIPQTKKRRQIERILVFAPMFSSPKTKNLSVLLRKIPENERLAGQWSLPLWEFPNDADGQMMKQRISEKFELLHKVKHVITHHNYEMYGIRAGVWDSIKVPQGHRFFAVDEIFRAGRQYEKFTVSRATQKILNFLVDSSS